MLDSRTALVYKWVKYCPANQTNLFQSQSKRGAWDLRSFFPPFVGISMQPPSESLYRLISRKTFLLGKCPFEKILKGLATLV